MAARTEPKTRTRRPADQAAEPVVQAHAKAKYVRVTPMKARRVINLIRGRQVPDALAVLVFAPQSASEPVRKVLASAVANARVRADREAKPFDERNLVVSAAYVDEGATMKRIQPRAQGRAYKILKRTSHITVHVSQPQSKGGAR